ncbi:MAG: hypothetical protein HRT40_03900, partial [Campylobacteraceae bacterium]|nr:hypothetical protein [Campylobacteraceae bacterium]
LTGKNKQIDERLNRDVNSINKELYKVNQIKGVDLSVDVRMLTEDGRNQIKEELERVKRLGQAVSDVVNKDEFIISDTSNHIEDVQKQLDVKKAISLKYNGKYVKILDDKDKSKYTQDQRDEALNMYAQEYSTVYVISIKEAKFVAISNYGATYTTKDNASSNVYIDDANNQGILKTVTTVDHEGSHARMRQGQTRLREGDLAEDYSDTMSSYSADGMKFSASIYANIDLNSNNTNNDIHRTQIDKEVLSSNTNDLNNDISMDKKGDGNIDDRKVTLTVRSFVPSATFANVLFGKKYHGDDRVYSTKIEDTSRVAYSADLDTEKHTIKDSVKSSETILYDRNGEIYDRGQGIPTKESSYDKKGNLAFEYEWTNPIAPFNAPSFATPSIDVAGKINFMDNPDGSLSIKGELTGDNFPSTEAFIIPDGSNTKVFLGIGQIDANVNPNSGGYDVPVALSNYYEKPISNFDLTLIYDEENNVTHVKNNNIKDSKPIALDTWNKIYENTSPKKKSE